jgi:hypothetical protein
LDVTKKKAPKVVKSICNQPDFNPKKHQSTTIHDWFEGGVVNVVSLLQAIIVGSPFLSKISIFLL